MTEHTIQCPWCHSNDIVLRTHQIKVENAQVEAPHTLYMCQACKHLALVTHWGNRQYVYRAIEQRRLFRSPTCIIIYDITCAWCGSNEHIEPVDINATVSNPAHRHHRYDIYACYACNHYSALAYLGEIRTYRAMQDTTYHTLYHLDDSPEEV